MNKIQNLKIPFIVCEKRCKSQFLSLTLAQNKLLAQLYGVCDTSRYDQWFRNKVIENEEKNFLSMVHIIFELCGKQKSLEIKVRLKTKLVGYQIWLESNVGWKPKLVGHQN